MAERKVREADEADKADGLRWCPGAKHPDHRNTRNREDNDGREGCRGFSRLLPIYRGCPDPISGFTHVNVGDLVKTKSLHAGKHEDEDFDSKVES